MAPSPISAMKKPCMARKRFPHYCPFVRGIHRRQWILLTRGSVMWNLDISFFIGLKRCWTNCRVSADPRPHDAQCGFTATMVTEVVPRDPPRAGIGWCATGNIQPLFVSSQGSFCVCAQPMGDDVTMQRRLSLAGRIHKMIHGSWLKYFWKFLFWLWLMIH